MTIGIQVDEDKRHLKSRHFRTHFGKNIFGEISEFSENFYIFVLSLKLTVSGRTFKVEIVVLRSLLKFLRMKVDVGKFWDFFCKQTEAPTNYASTKLRNCKLEISLIRLNAVLLNVNTGFVVSAENRNSWRYEQWRWWVWRTWNLLQLSEIIANVNFFLCSTFCFFQF